MTGSTDTGHSIELTAEQRQWVTAYLAAKQQLDAAQETLDRCREQLEQFLGDAETATFDGKTMVRYPTVISTRLDTKKLKEQRPDVYDEFARPQMSRRFTVVTP